MKTKLILIGVFVLYVFNVIAEIPPPLPADSVRQLNYNVIKTGESIIIDGSATESDWNSVPFAFIDQKTSSVGDAISKFKLLWNDDGLYLYVEVIDDTIVINPLANSDDTMKYYFYDYFRMHLSRPSAEALDSVRTKNGYFHSGTYHLGTAIMQPIHSGTDMKNGGDWSWPGTGYTDRGRKVVFGNLSGGYTIEQFIPWSLYGMDTIIGSKDYAPEVFNNIELAFDIAIGDIDKPGNATTGSAGELWWNNNTGDSDNMWFIINKDGKITLIDSTYFVSYSIPNQISAKIDKKAHYIDVLMPVGTNFSILTPSFIAGDGVDVKIGTNAQVSGVSVVNFENPVEYKLIEGTYEQKWTVVARNPNTETDFTEFNIPNQVLTGTINKENHTIEVLVPNNIDLTDVKPSFIPSFGANVYIIDVKQTSGVTSVDFSTKQVLYKIIAEDNIAEQIWTVNINIANDKDDFLSYSIPNEISSNLDNENHTINIVMPVGTDLTKLTPEFTISDKAYTYINNIEQISGTSIVDFSNGSTIYKIVAEDKINEQNWTINVSIASSSNELISFSIANSLGSSDINRDKHIVFTLMPSENTDISSLKPIFEVSPNAKVYIDNIEQISGVSIVDFLKNNDTVIYKIVAEDGITEQLWTVIVDVVTGINKSVNQKISIYPIPASNYIFLKNVNGATIYIYDIIGSKIETIYCSEANNQIDITKYNVNTIILQIQKGNNLTVKKIPIIR